jgi:HEAT repeat protein
MHKVCHYDILYATLPEIAQSGNKSRWITRPFSQNGFVIFRRAKKHPAEEGLNLAVAYLRSLPVFALPSFDSGLRNRSWSEPEWFPEMRSILAADTAAKLISRNADPAGAGVVLACHPNGFVREAAVGLVGDLSDPLQVPCLLLRSADWVPQVSTSAMTALLPAWRQISEDEKVIHLPLLSHLATESSRIRPFATQLLDDFLADIDVEQSLLLSHSDPRIRRILARRCSPRITTDRLVEFITNERDPRAAREFSKNLFLSHTLSDKKLIELAKAPVGSVRASALVAISKADTDESREVLQNALFDANVIVRSYAQAAVRKFAVDPRSVYVASWSQGDVRALLGLSEVATEAERALAESLLHSSSPKEQLCGVRMLLRLGVQDHALTDRCLELVESSRSKVARVALSLLATRPSETSLQDLWTIAKTHPSEGRRQMVVRFFLRRDRFTALHFALDGLVSSSDAGANLFDATMRSWNRSYTSPSPQISEQIRNIVPLALPKMDRTRAALLLHTIKPYVPGFDAGALLAWNTSPDSSSGTFYANEASQEIHQGHPLHGETFTTVATCTACDDVAFSSTDGSFVVIHLTYNKNERPPWPLFSKHHDHAALLAAMNMHAVDFHSDTME